MQGLPGRPLGKDGRGRSPADALPRGERGSGEDLSPQTHTGALSHTPRPTCTCACTHAWVHRHVCACVHVCAHVMTPALHQSLGPGAGATAGGLGPGPHSHPCSGPGEPGSAREPCPKVRGGPVEESGGTEARQAAPPPGHNAPAWAPTRRPLPGWQHSLRAAPCSPAFPSSHSLLRPPRGPPSPAAPPGSSSSALSMSQALSQPQCPLLSVSWGDHLAPPTCLWPAQPCHGDPRLQRGVSEHHECRNGRRGQAWALQEQAAGRG